MDTKSTLVIAGCAYSPQEQQMSAAFFKDKEKRKRWSRLPYYVALGIQIFVSNSYGDKRPVSDMAVILALSTGIYWYLKARRRFLVLWLRKFNQDPNGVAPFTSMLTSACGYFAVPVTVQDPTVKFSQEYLVTARPWMFLICILIGLMPIICFVVTLYLLSLIDWFSAMTHSEEFLYWWFCAACFMPLLAPGFWLVKWRLSFGGHHELKGSTGAKVAARFIRRVRAGWGSPGGMAVLRCEESLWKNVVAQCIVASAVVIIDVSDLTENILWELRVTFQRVPPKQVVLTCAVGGDLKAIPQETLDRISARVGCENIVSCLKYTYGLGGVHNQQEFNTVFGCASAHAIGLLI